MLKADLATLALIDKGVKPVYSAIIYFQQPETYTSEDFLESIGDITSSLSADGRYEINNTTLTLLNRGFYFSQKFGRELPNNKRCEVSMTIGSQTILIFSGIIGGNWTLTETLLTVNVNA